MKVKVSAIILVLVVALIPLYLWSVERKRKAVYQQQKELFEKLLTAQEFDLLLDFDKEITKLNLEMRYELAYQRIYDYDQDRVKSCLIGIISVKDDPKGVGIKFQDDYVYSACVESLSKKNSGFIAAGFKHDFLADYAMKILADNALSQFHLKVLQRLCKDRGEEDYYGRYARLFVIKKVSEISPTFGGFDNERLIITADEMLYLNLFCEDISVRFFRKNKYGKGGLLDAFSDDKKICAFLLVREQLITSEGLSSKAFVWIISDITKTERGLARNANLQKYLANPAAEYRKLLMDEPSSANAEITDGAELFK